MIKATVNQSIYEVKEGTTLSDLAKQVRLPGADHFACLYGWKVKRIIYSYEKACLMCVL